MRTSRSLLSPRAWILIFAVTLRLAVAAAFPSLLHPDENFQFFEQAHRLAFGYGVIPWELEDGIRSLLLPALFAGVMRVAAAAGASPLMYIFVCRALLAAVSLLAVAAVYDAGRRISTAHAIIGGVVAATWFEIVYFAGRPLTEAIAADLLIVALALASPGSRPLGTSTLRWIGACLGACLMLRVQLAPGLAVLAAWVCRPHLRQRGWPIIAGASVPIAAFGIADWIAWGSPFHSQLAAFRVNYLEGKASLYGTEPATWYLAHLFDKWSLALPVIALLVLVARRRAALWIAVGLVLIATHSLIPHKEYRFIFPALACLIVAAALGSADLVEALRARAPARTGWLTPLVCIAWMLASLWLARAPGFLPYWFKDANVLSAESALSRQPGLCGLLIYDDPWYETGGYAFLHRRVPLYRRPADAALPAVKAAANFAMVRRVSLERFAADYGLGRCLGMGSPADLCVVVRPGGCVADPAIESMLTERRLGE